MNNSMEITFDRVLMDAISDMVFVVRVENDSFVYDFLNRAALEGTGLTMHQLGYSIREVYPHEIANRMYEQYRKVATSGEIVIYEDSYVGTSGEQSYSETILNPILDKRGECTKIVAVVKDITSERLAQAEARETSNQLHKSEKRYESLYSQNTDGIISFDLSGRITHGNNAVEIVTGYTPAELIGTTFQSLVVEEDIYVLNKLFTQAVAGLAESDVLVIVNKTGEPVDLIFKVIPLIINNETIGLYGVLRDITESLIAKKKLEESEVRFRIIAENAHDLITLLNDKGEIIYVSPSYKNTLGYHHKEFIGKSFLHNIYADDITRLAEMVILSAKNGEPFNIEFKQCDNSGEMRWFKANGTPVFDNKGKFEHIVVLSRDIDDQKKYEEMLKYYALHDQLTGLPNRHLFNDHFKQAKENFHENNDGLAVIMMDIDHFKKINDELGHDIGDSVIKEFGTRLSQTVSNQGTVARLGGDEFAILLPSIGAEHNVVAIADSILKDMQKPWHIADEVLKVTTSMGIAMAPTEDFTKYSIMKNADIALYEAKNDGRNSYKLFV